VLVDTGPLVAMLNKNDQHREDALSTLDQLQPPLLTTWPVLTETAYFVRDDADLFRSLLSGRISELLEIVVIDQTELSAMNEIFNRYADLNLQLADLSLMHLANRDRIQTVFTFDHRDFRPFMADDGSSLKLIP